MSIEEALSKLTAAVEANTAALKGGAAASTGSSGGTSASKGAGSKTKAADTAKKVTPEQAMAALTKLKDDYLTDKQGLVKAKEILANHGFQKMAEISADKAATILAEADAAYAELKAASESSEDGDL